MRINIYAEEITQHVEIVEKTTPDGTFTGIRFWLHLPVTLVDGTQAQGPFIHGSGDDDSSAVTFWGKRDIATAFAKALTLLDAHRNRPVMSRLESDLAGAHFESKA